MTRSQAQGDLFGPPPQEAAKPHGRTKCRRAGCSHAYAVHGPNGCNDAVGFCLCDAFLSPSDIAPTVRRQATPSEGAYREAYERGIRRASPQPFAVVGTRVGSILGTVAKVHAVVDDKPITGKPLLDWIEQAAHDFRKATAGEPQYWSGWQPYAFAKWQMARVATAEPKPEAPTRLQPLAPRRPPKPKRAP